MKNNSSFLIMAICLFLLQGCTIDYANAVDITLKNNLDSPITVVIQNRDLASQYDIAIIDRKCEHRIVHSGYMSGSPDIEHNDMFWDSEARMLLPLSIEVIYADGNRHIYSSADTDASRNPCIFDEEYFTRTYSGGTVTYEFAFDEKDYALAADDNNNQ